MSGIGRPDVHHHSRQVVVVVVVLVRLLSPSAVALERYGNKGVVFPSRDDAERTFFSYCACRTDQLPI